MAEAAETNKPHVRQILDDLFDAFTLLGRGSYVSLYDVKGQMTRYTPAAVELFGLPGEYIPAGAYNWSDYVHPEDRKRYEKIMGDLLASKAKGYDLTYRTKLKDGSYALFRYIGAVLRDDEGAPELVGGIFINEGLMENTDPITVLRNQYGFFQDLAAAKEMGKACRLMLIGIGGMRTINEHYGYTYGNHVLQQTGWLLQEVLGMDGVVYRVDGTRFAFLTERLSSAEITERYGKIARTLLAGITVDGVRQTIAASGGMVTTSGKEMDERILYACLRYACEESKLRHNGAMVNYDGNLDQNLMEHLSMLQEIRDSITLGCEGFSLRYQPVVRTDEETIIGVEALLIWHSERFGDVSPAAYVPVLEKDYVFEELGYWILRKAMEDGVRMLERNERCLLGINIAPVQILDEFFADEIATIAGQTGFPLNRLCLELTKECSLIETKLLAQVVASLRERGVLCLIDDFGSGLAPVDTLESLAPDYIKIERKYMGDLEENDRHRRIVRRLARLAHDCGAKVCIKGIERKAAGDIVKKYAVCGLQGDYYARPLPVGELLNTRYFLRKNG